MQGFLSFKFMGANSSKVATWVPMLAQLRNRLISYVSLGGRKFLGKQCWHNSVLNSILIFYLSFLKVPKKILKMIVRIQMEFLWGGARGSRRICWVNWNKVCQPKSKGGLGVKDLRVFNLCPLAKWRWQLIQDEQLLWKRGAS
jgi:hypothetical protein